MNKLPLEKRVQILNMLVEGSSMRSIERVAGVSINTVSKLLVEAGRAAEAVRRPGGGAGAQGTRSGATDVLPCATDKLARSRRADAT